MHTQYTQFLANGSPYLHKAGLLENNPFELADLTAQRTSEYKLHGSSLQKASHTLSGL